MKRKFYVFLTGILIATSLTACSGASTSNSESNGTGFNVDATSDYNSAGLDANLSSDYQEPEAYKSAESVDDYDTYENEESDTDNSEQVEEQVEEQVDEQTDSDDTKSDIEDKLVYHGDVTLDSIKYDESIEEFKKLLDKYDAFVESENVYVYDDNYYSYDSNVERAAKIRNYYASVRIPSKHYEELMTGVADLGEITAQSSNVQNFKQEYKDVSISLDILQQSYKAYSKMLDSATDINNIIEIQDKLTELETQIEQAKGRLNQIDNDVAYSYIDVHINEVSKYKEPVLEDDTFAQRVKKAFVESLENIQSMFEGVVLNAIRYLPAIIIGITLIILIIKLLVFVKSKLPKVKMKNNDLANQFNQTQNGHNMQNSQNNIQNNNNNLTNRK